MAIRAVDPDPRRAAGAALGAENRLGLCRRTLIAAELVFGASSGGGGLGWYIFQNRNEMYTDRVFAGLVMVTAIGLLVEGLVFATTGKADGETLGYAELAPEQEEKNAHDSDESAGKLFAAGGVLNKVGNTLRRLPAGS